ncbi:MAG: acyl-CoA dehydrogenase [Leptospiraceae bacterium]|nr:acyl-CoA dehydrogenase [Leptospiraceae bacterium]MCP5497106.1 acyl-CoA dehydrogenase [Leptospiraceae bacterium]
MILLNPKKTTFEHLDPSSREIMKKTIGFFEKKGKASLKEDDHERTWYRDFLDFVKENKIFATLLTPSKYGSDGDYRWDTYRNCDFNEILGFYGLYYWYTWQVTILGLGPLWMSKNEKIKQKTAQLLNEGGIFGYGLSEKEHGADIRSNSMTLTKKEDGTYVANGRKYYIGNGNEAAILSTQGKLAENGQFVFFAASSKHKSYTCVKNVVNRQAYVAEYILDNYPITEDDILSIGRDAWDSALNTVNLGKWNLGWASIGMCTHSFYEAINHASTRRIFARYVTDFPHVRQLFVDAYSRLAAMKLFSSRASDYMRAASKDDRRYLLYDPTVKMFVTLEGEKVINHLWDVIAAKGFEKDMYFEGTARDIRALPKLEGTVHVNMILIIRFIQNFLFNPKEYPELSRQTQKTDDDFLFNQGSSQKGLNQIQFHDYNKAYNSFNLPNINVFKEQIELLKQFFKEATPSEEQNNDLDYMLTIGFMFTLIVYGQLILEMCKMDSIDKDLIDQIFHLMVRDFSLYAAELHNKESNSAKQSELCIKMIKKPVKNEDRFNNVWEKHVYSLKEVYEMNP